MKREKKDVGNFISKMKMGKCSNAGEKGTFASKRVPLTDKNRGSR